jgi:hypothetical protein
MNRTKDENSNEGKRVTVRRKGGNSKQIIGRRVNVKDISKDKRVETMRNEKEQNSS